ncbi:MAG: TonB-dependent receptor [Woeseiaceae bacterium]|nr:TonB-dependent receptor [Woeseiaceae bacterium]
MAKLRNFKDLSAGLKLTAVTTALASAAVVVFTLPTIALAQDGAASAMLEEIVTTARKRSKAEAVQDVPIAISAFGAVQLDALFVKKLDDLSYLMPNVQLEAVGTFPGVQNFSIRGQGINSSIPSVDPTVGVFVDGVYMGTTYGVVIDTFDLESVEVLRGPQGLLFGRNVTGGAVVLRNARPDGEFGARVRVGATDAQQYNMAAALEGSLIQDKLAGKVVVYYDDDQGYYEGTTIGRDVGAMTTKIIRPTFVWTPNEHDDVTLIMESGESKGDGAIWSNVTAQRAGAIPEFTTIANDPGYTDMKWHQAMLEVNIADVGKGTLTNIAGWRHVGAASATDIDGISAPIFYVPGSTSQDQVSNEIRWSGDVTDNWQATAGLYYFEQNINYREGRYIQVVVLRALGGDMDAKNVGAFWNNDFQILDDFSMSVGLRYTGEKKSAQIISGVGGGCTEVVTFDCTFDNLSGDWTNVTPKIGLQWELGDSGQIYSFWSKGYRSGGFNFRNAKPNVIPPGPTKEEENTTIEIGYKSDFLDGRMRLNAAIFHNEIEGMQRELNIGDPDVVVLQGTINAGDVTIWGLELDFVGMITDNFSVSASYGHQEGEYDKVNPDFASFLGPDLPRLAPNNYSVGLSLDLPMSGAGLINLATNYSFREEHPYNDSNTEIFGDQKRLSASANWFLPNDAWQISLYGKNLTDEANWGNLTSIAGLFTAGPMQKGRIYGLEVNYRQ